ncbi:MAG: hypothetical protein MJ014_02355, partial [Methanocorpusculum sp.]|nr:hypothetical protein [Methanocorpusculum sp.]
MLGNCIFSDDAAKVLKLFVIDKRIEGASLIRGLMVHDGEWVVFVYTVSSELNFMTGGGGGKRRHALFFRILPVFFYALN